jgi:hypothetical protein
MSTLLTDNNAAIIQHGFGKPFADLIASICTTIDTLGGDNSAAFNSITPPSGTLTVTGNAIFIDALVTVTMDNGGFTITNSGSNSAVTTVATATAVIAVENTNVEWSMTAGASPDSLVESITSTTGAYATSLTANLADAWSITDGAGSPSDLLSFTTTTSALSVNVSAALVSTPPANQTLTNSATITLPVGINKVVDNGGAVTGIIMTAGLYDGQIVNVINAAAASVTFATAGTSHVADGTSAVIAANHAITLIYDTGSSLWYRTG